MAHSIPQNFHDGHSALYVATEGANRTIHFESALWILQLAFHPH